MSEPMIVVVSPIKVTRVWWYPDQEPLTFSRFSLTDPGTGWTGVNWLTRHYHQWSSRANVILRTARAEWVFGEYDEVDAYLALEADATDEDYGWRIAPSQLGSRINSHDGGMRESGGGYHTQFDCKCGIEEVTDQSGRWHTMYQVTSRG